MTMVPQAPDILSAEFAADPYPAYRVLREHYPLLWHEGTDSWLLSRYDDVERAFRDPVFTTDNYDWQLEPVHGGRTILQMSGARTRGAPGAGGAGVPRQRAPGAVPAGDRAQRRAS